jgi:predicted nucleic acid-binding protein
VVDASVAFGWFAAIPGSEQAVRLLDPPRSHRLIAPDLVLVELLNAGWKSERMGAIAPAQFMALAQLAPELFAELVPAAALLPRAQSWCSALDHPADACLYLAPAEREQATLITADRGSSRRWSPLDEARDGLQACRSTPVVIAAGQDQKQRAVDAIHEPVAVVDAA